MSEKGLGLENELMQRRSGPGARRPIGRTAQTVFGSLGLMSIMMENEGQWTLTVLAKACLLVARRKSQTPRVRQPTIVCKDAQELARRPVETPHVRPCAGGDDLEVSVGPKLQVKRNSVVGRGEEVDEVPCPSVITQRSGTDAAGSPSDVEVTVRPEDQVIR